MSNSRDTDYYKSSVFHYIKKSTKKKFFKQNALLCLIGSVISILAYAPLVFSKGYCADLEYMYQGNGLYNWSELGRFNLILLKYIASFGKYRPILEGVLFSFTMAALFVALFGFFVNIINKENTSTVPAAFAALLCLVFPTFTEQYYFRFQCFEVAFALLLLVISNISLTDFIRTKKYPLAIISVILPALSFGTYQSMMNVAVTFYFGMFLVMLFNFDKGKIKFGAISCTLQFLLSLGLYKLITLIFCEKGSYIGNKVMWGQYPISTCYHFVVHYIRVVLFGEKYVYTLSFLICILLGFIAVVILFIKEKFKAVWSFAGFAGLCASPFIMAIIQGFEAEARTQLALPFAIGFLWFFFVSVIFKYIKSVKKSDKETIVKNGTGKENTDENTSNVQSSNLFRTISVSLICLISVIVFGLNSYKTEKLVLSAKDIVNSDLEITKDIISDLSEFNCLVSSENSKPVILIGIPDSELSARAYTYNEENKLYMLTSVYFLDSEVEPKYFFSTNRVLGFCSFLGTDFNRPNVSNYMEEAYTSASDMPSYPEEGFIKESDNCIVVKLSDI